MKTKKEYKDLERDSKTLDYRVDAEITRRILQGHTDAQIDCEGFTFGDAIAVENDLKTRGMTCSTLDYNQTIILQISW